MLLEVCCLRECVGSEHKLLAGNSKAFLRPELVFLQTCCHIQQAFIVDGDSVVSNVILAGVGEEIVVDDADVAIGLPDKLQRLIDVLHFVVVRVGNAVGRNETVDAEGTIVGLVAKVATVGEILHTILLLENALIHPVPNGSATDGGVIIDHVPVLLEVAHRVTHRMGVFTHHEGTVGNLFCF